MSQDLATKAKEILGRYPAGRGRSALLPLLHLVQDRDGFVTEQGMGEVARILDLTTAEVNSVATFYTMYHLRPKGRHVVSICHNLACSLAGAEKLISSFEEALGIAVGATSADGDVTLERVECLAACDLAPMLQVDYDQMSGPIRIEDVSAILGDLKSGSDDVPIEQPPVIVPAFHEVASQPAIESEPRGTTAPEVALDPHPVPAPSAFTAVTEMAVSPPVTSAPVLRPANDDDRVITPEPIKTAEEEFQPGPPTGPIVHVASDDDFVKEEKEEDDEEVELPAAALNDEGQGTEPPATSPDDQPEETEPAPLIDSITLSDEDEELLRDSTARRGQERRKYSAERLLEEPTYEGGVGPGPADPRDIGAPLPPPSDEPEPPIRPRGAE